MERSGVDWERQFADEYRYIPGAYPQTSQKRSAQVAEIIDSGREASVIPSLPSTTHHKDFAAGGLQLMFSGAKQVVSAFYSWYGRGAPENTCDERSRIAGRAEDSKEKRRRLTIEPTFNRYRKHETETAAAQTDTSKNEGPAPALHRDISAETEWRLERISLDHDTGRPKQRRHPVAKRVARESKYGLLQMLNSLGNKDGSRIPRGPANPQLLGTLAQSSPHGNGAKPSKADDVRLRLQEVKEETDESGRAKFTKLPQRRQFDVISDDDDDTSSDDTLSQIHVPSGASLLGDNTFDDLEHGFDSLKLSEAGQEERARILKEAARRKKAAAEAAAKLAEEEEKARLEAQRLLEELERKGKRRMPSRSFIRDSGVARQNAIEKALSMGPTATLTTTLDGTALRSRDLMSVLGATSWLNDEVINGYLEWIVHEANKASKPNSPAVVTFNSFFYAKLAKEGYKGVARWSKRKKIDGKKLLNTETILIPINNASHWTLLVVSPKAKTVEYFDSFGAPPGKFARNAIVWLQGELGKDFNEEEWEILDTACAKQKNGYDCGVFLLTNAECVTFGLDTCSYSGLDMAKQRRRIAAVLLAKEFSEYGTWHEA